MEATAQMWGPTNGVRVVLPIPFRGSRQWGSYNQHTTVIAPSTFPTEQTYTGGWVASTRTTGIALKSLKWGLRDRRRTPVALEPWDVTGLTEVSAQEADSVRNPKTLPLSMRLPTSLIPLERQSLLPASICGADKVQEPKPCSPWLPLEVV